MNVILLLLLCVAAALEKNISLVDQRNAAELTPDVLRNTVLCQRATDIYGFPLVYAADDAVLPPLAHFRAHGVQAGVDDCHSLSVQLWAIRTRQDRAPDNLTLQFWRHNATTRGPGALFYAKTFAAPLNNAGWRRDVVGQPWAYLLRLQLNEVGDDGVTRFNFRDPYFLGAREQFWLAFYCSVARHRDAGPRTNGMYWLTLNRHPRTVGALQSTLFGAPNHNFVFRDAADLLELGLTNWTPAPEAQRALQLTAQTTHNLAFHAYMTCSATTDAPTRAPTEPVPMTRGPTATPSVAPSLAESNSSAVTTAPAISALGGVALAITALGLLATASGLVVFWMSRQRKADIVRRMAETTPSVARLRAPPTSLVQQPPRCVAPRADVAALLDDRIYTDSES